MNLPAKKIRPEESVSPAHFQAGKQGDRTTYHRLADNRLQRTATQTLQKIANAPKRTERLELLQAMANHRAPAVGESSPEAQIILKKENDTGLPDQLKSSIENLSGYSMDDVRVHYNSTEPGQVAAHAFARGSEIHLAPGQETHLPHEAWHVVQQKQGRVRPTAQLKGKIKVNDDHQLEREADVMAGKASTFVDNRPETIMQRKLHRLLNQQSLKGAGTAQPIKLDRWPLNSLPAPVIQRQLSQDEFNEIENLAKKIIQQYPPDNYHYLGLGKSPTPVMAYLQAYGAIQPAIEATNMPLSKFGHRTGSNTAAEKVVVTGDPLDAEQRGRLWDHFDAFIPGPGNLQGKNILLIDLVQSGRSLVATQRHLQEYLQAQYRGTGATGLFFGVLSTLSCFPAAPNVVALPLAIEEQQVEGTKKTMDSLGLSANAMMIPGKFDDTNSLSHGMGSEKYKPQAEYPDDFKISAVERPKTGDIERDPHGKYEKLKSEFSRFLKIDGPLVRLLEGSDEVDNLKEGVSTVSTALLKME